MAYGDPKMVTAASPHAGSLAVNRLLVPSPIPAPTDLPILERIVMWKGDSHCYLFEGLCASDGSLFDANPFLELGRGGWGASMYDPRPTRTPFWPLRPLAMIYSHDPEGRAVGPFSYFEAMYYAYFYSN